LGSYRNYFYLFDRAIYKNFNILINFEKLDTAFITKEKSTLAGLSSLLTLSAPQSRRIEMAEVTVPLLEQSF